MPRYNYISGWEAVWQEAGNVALAIWGKPNVNLPTYGPNTTDLQGKNTPAQPANTNALIIPVGLAAMLAIILIILLLR